MSATPPFCSVCVAVYNGEEYLATALESVASQTFTDYELVVLDDGSTDRSGEIASTVDCKLIRQENAGIGAARRRLLAEASGAWVVFLDHDDYWDPDFLARMAPLTSDPGVVHVYCDAWIVNPAGEKSAPGLPPTLGPESLGHIIPHRIWNPCSIFNRQAMMEAGSFREGMKAGEDWLGWFLLASRGSLKFLDDKLVYVMRRPNSTSSPTRAYYEAERSVVVEVLDRFDDLYQSLAPPRRNFYKKKLREKLGLITSLIATWYDVEGDRRKARELHNQALHLAPRLKGVWYRYLRSAFGMPCKLPGTTP